MTMTFRQPHDTDVSKKLPSVQAVFINWIRLLKFAEEYDYSSCSKQTNMTTVTGALLETSLCERAKKMHSNFTSQITQ